MSFGNGSDNSWQGKIRARRALGRGIARGQVSLRVRRGGRVPAYSDRPGVLSQIQPSSAYCRQAPGGQSVNTLMGLNCRFSFLGYCSAAAAGEKRGGPGGLEFRTPAATLPGLLRVPGEKRQPDECPLANWCLCQ